MKTMTVEDRLYGALEKAATRDGRPVQDLLTEAIESWLADAALDDADRAVIERSRAEAAEQGGVEFEAFFEGLLADDD
ncbi:MAG: hypothetical protein F4X26_12225 [Chloroflexi bacterium]|nr:hypothetical protein [Chloroflexota bacterium]